MLHIVVLQVDAAGKSVVVEGTAVGTEGAGGSTRKKREGETQKKKQVRGYFLVFVPTIREIRDFYREMQRTDRESITMCRSPSSCAAHR